MASYAVGAWTSTNNTISGNSAYGDGGGVYFFGDNCTSIGDTISGNSAEGDGGGVYNAEEWMSMRDTISDNLAKGDGGGGVYNTSGWTSTNDTISGNSATSSNGGGVFNDDGDWISTNDTISSNVAADGGGIFSSYSYDWISVNNTIAGNTATDKIGGGVDLDGSTTSIINTIISGNSGGDFSGSVANITTSNLIGGAVTQILATDANGEPLLANNGGPTQTIALVAGSPAIGKAVALATLTQNLAPGATTMYVADGTFLAVGQQLKIDNEVVTVTATGINTIGISRAAGGGTSHASGAAIELAYDATGALRTPNDIGAVEKIVDARTTVVVDGGAGYAETSGNWATSGLKGVNNTATRYSNAAGATATWTPTLAPGYYTVTFYNVVASNSSTSAQVNVVANGTTTSRTINQAAGTSGFITLGTFYFAGTGGEESDAQESQFRKSTL